uniref:anthranilate synthase n=1 Tax=Vitis vinifera TaxID=29760 RepID=A5B2H7_VITVI|nr:hypothetical protein VITISV_018043 [Vitis vinifera]
MASLLSQSALFQSKSSLPFQTLESPRNISSFSFQSKRLYVLGAELRCGSVVFKEKDGFALKASMSIAESNSRSPVLDNGTKNPIVVIDNYDSFTYNLCQYLGELGCNFEVYRNDELSVEELKKKNPRGVLISPGPGTPQDSGISLQTVLELGPVVPLFGVCMGLQCIGEAFGGKSFKIP